MFQEDGSLPWRDQAVFEQKNSVNEIERKDEIERITRLVDEYTLYN